VILGALFVAAVAIAVSMVLAVWYATRAAGPPPPAWPPAPARRR
jgi:hypothetical protein